MIQFLGNYIDGEFIREESGASYRNENPFDLDEPLFEWRENLNAIEPAIEGAQTALKMWRSLSLNERLAYFEKLKSTFEKYTKDFEETIILETGKARWEATIEAKAVSSKLHITVTDVLDLIKKIETTGFAPEQSYFRLRPRGVCGVLGPFNFPLHLSNGHILPALMLGNTVVYKPSEFAPQSATLYAKCFDEAGFPAGVIQLLHGGKETGRRLVENKAIDAIFFTGSYEVGERITRSVLETREDLDTLTALEMGGKNAAIIDETANQKNALAEVLSSAFATTGQRCSSTSRVLVDHKIYDEFKEKLIAAVKSVPFGDPQDPKTFMGPLIHGNALASYLENCQRAKSEGFSPLVDANAMSEKNCLIGPSLYEKESPEDTESFKTEFFGPNILLSPYRDREEMARLHEATPFGLVASVFSQNKEFLDFCDDTFEVGLLNWNRGTVGANSKLPFGGVKRSGNNWPAGLFSFLYCAKPRSYLQRENVFEAKTVPAPLKESIDGETER